MTKSNLLSVKNWSAICSLASVAILLYYITPWGLPKFALVALVVLGVFAFIKSKSEITIKMVSLAIVLSALLSIGRAMGVELPTSWLFNVLNFLLAFIPLCFAFYKEKGKAVKLGIALVCVTLLSRLTPLILSYSINFSSHLFAISIGMFFLSSAIDTKDTTTKYISYGSASSAVILLIGAIINTIYALCDKPDYKNLYSWINYDVNQYPVFHFCMEIGGAIRLLSWIGALIMVLYFFYLLKRSNWKLKAICISSMVACLLMCSIYSGVLNSIITDHIMRDLFDFNTSQLYGTTGILIYALFTYAFQKLYKIL